MPAPAELSGWSDERWAAVTEAIDRAVAGAAVCRHVVPEAPAPDGGRNISYPAIAAGGPPFVLAPDTVAGPIQIFADLRLDDDHIDDEPAILRLVQTGAAYLGTLEDEEIILGAAPVPGGAAPPPRVPRNPALGRANIGPVVAGAPAIARTPINPAAGVPGSPTAQELMAALTTAVAALEVAERSGPCGLLLQSELLAVLRIPPFAGAPPAVQQVEELIRSSEIAGTGVLISPGAAAAGASDVGGVLFRLEPPAVDLVRSKPSTFNSTRTCCRFH